ncbi:12612_t:CDS:2 [Dentiscutata heterogama]|uniref:12612_t:CDS:1 n=1 Tax=Dentiscutata heterogama TaxID=1316150 RepID=A0ACA9LFM7_9GLOM|nr:12612_t:CDS:2 [Dentiscutata heterogama]
MDSFLLTNSLLRNLLRIQRYLQESSAAIICITDDTIEFLDEQGEPTEIIIASDINGAASNENLQKVEDPALEIEKPKGELDSANG